MRFKSGGKKGTTQVEAQNAQKFAQSITNIFRLNMFEEAVPAALKKKAKSPKQSSSKRTVKERERVKLIKRLTFKRREEAKKRKVWREYLVRLAKGQLAKGEKAPPEPAKKQAVVAQPSRGA